MRINVLAFLVLLLSALPAAVGAAELTPPPRTDDKGWIVTVSVIGAVTPSFPGSNQSRVYPFPSVDIRREGAPETFSTPDEGFGFPVLDLETVKAGPVANFVFPRGQSPGLFGMRQIGLTHEIGGYVEVHPMEHIRLRAEMRQGIDGHKGFYTALYADAYETIGPLRLSVGPRLNLGDTIYANAFFSVTPFESLLNGRLTPYQATGGLASVGGMATIRYAFTETMSVSFYGGAWRLLGSMGSSPIPNVVGSPNQFNAGLAVSRSFVVPNFLPNLPNWF